MNGELGQLRVRDVGLVRGSPVIRGRTSVIRGSTAGVAVRRFPGAGKVDPFDTAVTKLESLRPACPVAMVEDAWTKLNSFLIDITPPINILPATMVP